MVTICYLHFRSWLSIEGYLLLLYMETVVSKIGLESATVIRSNLSKTTKCLTNAVSSTFVQDQPIYISVPETYSNGSDIFPIKDFFANNEWFFRISSEESETDLYATWEINKKYKHYIILFQFTRKELEEDIIVATVNERFSNLQNSFLWTHRGKFIVLFIVQGRISAQTLASRTLQELWKYYSILDVLLLVLQATQDNSSCESCTLNNNWTWSTFTSFTECGLIKYINFSDKCIPDKINTSYVTSSPNQKILDMFNGCKIKIISYLVPPVVMKAPINSGSHYNGFELTSILTILNKLNITPFYKILPDNTKDHLQQFIYTIQELVPSSTDIAIGALPFSGYINPFSAESTIPYGSTQLLWIVPCPDESSRWLAFTETFSLPVWLCICFEFIIVSISMTFLSQCSKFKSVREISNYSTLSSSLYNTFSVTLGVSVSEMPRSSNLRIVFLTWVYYCIVITMIYETFVTGFLVNPGFEHGIQTVEELIASGIPYGTLGDFHDFADSDNVYQIISKNRMECASYFKCLEMPIKYRNFATISDGFHIDYFKIRLSFYGHPLPVCSLPLEVFQFSFSTYMSKGNPLLGVFDKIIRHFLEADLYVKWTDDYMSQLKLDGKSLDGDDVDYSELNKYDLGTSTSFSLVQLQVVFYMLLFGLLFSLLVLLLEILHFKIICNRTSYKSVLTTQTPLNQTQNKNIRMTQSSLYKSRVHFSQTKYYRQKITFVMNDFLNEI
ncbi:Ionotropic receptor 660 [Blattella germanica]|nr:Ionotropic receptor 660 [Blattella germanica]